MNTEILTLSQLLSPGFPVGSFAYSHGLEAAIGQGHVHDRESLSQWLDDVVAHGGGHADAVLLAMAFQAKTDEVGDIDDTARAFAASAERLKEADLQGAAFCDAFKAGWAIDLGRLTYPVAVGQAATRLKLPLELTTAMYLQAFVANLCGAAMRLVPLGQTDGQQVQSALQATCLSKAAEAHTAGLDDLYSCAFMSDIMAMQHECQDVRLFRT